MVRNEGQKWTFSRHGGSPRTETVGKSAALPKGPHGSVSGCRAEPLARAATHLPDERRVREGRPDVCIFVKLMILCKFWRRNKKWGSGGVKGPTWGPGDRVMRGPSPIPELT